MRGIGLPIVPVEPTSSRLMESRLCGRSCILCPRMNSLSRATNKAEKFHSEWSSLRKYHVPFNLTFHLCWMCWGWTFFYWSMLKVAVALKICHCPLNQVIPWQRPQRSRSIAWWCHCPMVLAVDGFIWIIVDSSRRVRLVAKYLLTMESSSY